MGCCTFHEVLRRLFHVKKSAGRMGRPRAQIDMPTALAMSANGISKAAIARRFNVSDSTIRARFKEIEGTPVAASDRGSALVSEVRSDVDADR